MAHFRKKKEREREGRNHVLLLLEAQIKCQMTDRLCTFAAANSDVHMHASMHACKQRHGPCACVHGEVQSEQATMRRDTGMGELGESSKHKPRKTPVVCAAEEEMPLAAQSCTCSVITSNLIKWRLG